MNEDFSEIFSKFQNILKEKDIDLNNFTSNSSSNDISSNKDDTNSCSTDSEINNSSNNSDFSLDIETILKIKDIISKINQNRDCPRNKLLHSLKPYLEENKQDKLEQYIKIANLLTILETQNININFLNTKEKGYDYILIITLFLLIF